MSAKLAKLQHELDAARARIAELETPHWVSFGPTDGSLLLLAENRIVAELNLRAPAYAGERSVEASKARVLRGYLAARDKERKC